MIAEMPEEYYNKIIQGDPRCEYTIGTRIVKATEEKGDIHSIGSPGVIKGSIFNEKTEGLEEMECYLVRFDTDAHDSFTIKPKLALESEFESTS